MSIVKLTAVHDTEIAFRWVQMEARDYLVKQVDTSELQLKGLIDPVRVLEITTHDKDFGNPPSEQGQHIFSLIEAISRAKSRVFLSTPVIENARNRKDIGLLHARLLEAHKRGVNVCMLCSGYEAGSVMAAAEYEKAGLKVRFCGRSSEVSIDLIDNDVVIFVIQNQESTSPGNKYLRITSNHINSALASDFEERWLGSISPGDTARKIFV